MASGAIETLKQELAAKRAEIQQKNAEAGALEQAIAVLSGNAILVADANGTLPTSTEYQGLGIADAAKRFIKESGGTAKSTREIADVLLRRGFQTKSKNFVATVYSTLVNSRQFQRTKDDNWIPKELTK